MVPGRSTRQAMGGCKSIVQVGLLEGPRPMVSNLARARRDENQECEDVATGWIQGLLVGLRMLHDFNGV